METANKTGVDSIVPVRVGEEDKKRIRKAAEEQNRAISTYMKLAALYCEKNGIRV